MGQLPLNIRPRLPYSPEGFLVHDGVASLVSLCLAPLSTDHSRFGFSFIYGPPRSGKTHLSILLAHNFAELGFYPHLVDGADLAVKLPILSPQEGEVLIVDDAHLYLESLRPGDSGPLVSCIEMYRKCTSRVVFLSAVEISKFTFDEHIRSRLNPGGGLEIKPPSIEFLSELINRMAKQRGIRLSDRKISFLLKRLERNIPEIEEYLERVDFLSTVFGRSIKLPLLSEAL